MTGTTIWRGGTAQGAALEAAGAGIGAAARVELFLDPGSFEELDAHVTHRCHDFRMAECRPAGDGVVCGHGTVHGRPVFVYAHDRGVFAGTVSEANARKLCKVHGSALEYGVPLVGLYDSGGERVQEGMRSLGGCGEVLGVQVTASGVIPQIAVLLGSSSGAGAHGPSLCDFVISPPEEAASAETDFVRPNVAACLSTARDLLGRLPLNNLEDAPPRPSDDPVDRRSPELDRAVPDSPSRPYDIRTILAAVFDDGGFLEVREQTAKNLVVGFAHLGGRSVGVVANQPAYLAGVLDIAASVKGARFVRFCDAFGLPVVTFVDVPGFLPGVDQELGGIIKHGAKLLYAYAQATVPKLTVITRKAYGGAYAVMGSKHLRTDANFAYPGAEIAVMGAEAAVDLLYRRELAAAGDEAEGRRRARIDEFRDRFSNPRAAAELGFVDAVIEPRETRPRLIRSLERALSKRPHTPWKKHGSIPL